MPAEKSLTRRQRIDWTVLASVGVLATLGQAYELRERLTAWPELLPGIAMLVYIASLLAADRRPGLARTLQVVGAAIAGAAALYTIEHWPG